jgi:hypothetical protein
MHFGRSADQAKSADKNARDLEFAPNCHKNIVARPRNYFDLSAFSRPMPHVEEPGRNQRSIAGV